MQRTLGPIVGAVTPDSAKVWCRAPAAGPYTCHVWTDSNLRHRAPGSPFLASATEQGGGTVTFRLRLPAAETLYFYDILDREGLSILDDGPTLPSFFSAPRAGLAGVNTSLRFGLVSCNNMRAGTGARRTAMWRRLARTFEERDVRFLLAAGDQVYADEAYETARRRRHPRHEDVVAAYRRQYETHWGHGAITDVLSNFPTYMIWDDHEVRNGWGSRRTDRNEKPQALFSAARQVYGEFQHAHNPDTPPGQFSYGFRFGDIGVFALDLRGARDIARSRDPLLGARQWRRLRAWLREEAPQLQALFVVTSVPIVHVTRFVAQLGDTLGSTDLRDQWTYPANRVEQDRILRLLFDVANEHDIPVTLLGGDVHVGTIACIRSHHLRHIRQPLLYQLTSSPVANVPNRVSRLLTPDTLRLDGGYEGRMLTYVEERNFGLVDVTWDEESGRSLVVLELHRESAVEPLRYPIG